MATKKQIEELGNVIGRLEYFQRHPITNKHQHTINASKHCLMDILHDLEHEHESENARKATS